MTDETPPDGYKVGYKRPPLRTRFQKGQSGNPRGRQKGARNFATDVKRTLEIPVSLNDKGRKRRVSTQEALILRLREKALNGDNRAIETLVGLARVHNNDDTAELLGQAQLAPEDQEILEAFAEQVRSRPPARTGQTPPPGEPERGEPAAQAKPEGRGDD